MAVPEVVDRPAIRFHDVSKRFRMNQQRDRSLLDLFRRLARGRQEREYFWPLKEVSFEIPWGRTAGLIGENGSGKSTILKLISRILEPTSGTVEINGRVSALLELGAGFHPELTGRENIFLNGALLGFSRADIQQHIADIIRFAEIGSFIDIPVKHYSSGMYVRLGFAISVHLDPSILLIDEVLAVGDAAFQHKCLERIADLRRSQVTIVLVSHDLGTVQSLCETVIWFDDGQIRAQGHPTDVIMAYLNQVAREEEAAATARPKNQAVGDRRWGSREIEIVEVQLCDGGGASKTVFSTGEELEIRLRYQTSAVIDEPVFGLAIHHQSGTHICGPNTYFGGIDISSLSGQGWISYRIPSLPLLEGGYELSISVHNREDTQMYDYHDRLYPFRVYPGKSLERYGLVTLNGCWETSVDAGVVEAEERAVVSA